MNTHDLTSRASATDLKLCMVSTGLILKLNLKDDTTEKRDIARQLYDIKVTCHDVKSFTRSSHIITGIQDQNFLSSFQLDETYYTKDNTLFIPCDDIVCACTVVSQHTYPI